MERYAPASTSASVPALPHDARLTVVNLVACQPIPTPFGGTDPDEARMLVLVDCEEGGRR